MSRRLFVALDPAVPLQKILADLNPKVRGVRWTEPEQLHLTLGFFGDVPENVDLKLRDELSAIQFGAFFLPIIGIGCFPPKGIPKIIWIGVGRGHPHLFQVYKRVQEAALASGLEPELRPWHPHITLGRCGEINPGAVRNFLKANVDFDAGIVRVDAFHLYSSKLTSAGPIHTCELSVHCRE